MNELEWLTEQRPETAPDDERRRAHGAAGARGARQRGRCGGETRRREEAGGDARAARRGARTVDAAGSAARASPRRGARAAADLGRAARPGSTRSPRRSSPSPSSSPPARCPAATGRGRRARGPPRRRWCGSSERSGRAGADGRRDARAAHATLPRRQGVHGRRPLPRRRPLLLRRRPARGAARGAAAHRHRSTSSARSRPPKAAVELPAARGAQADDRRHVGACRASPPRGAARQAPAGNGPTPTPARRSIEDNHVWIGSMDALIAGAGRTDVRAGRHDSCWPRSTRSRSSRATACEADATRTSRTATRDADRRRRDGDPAQDGRRRRRASAVGRGRLRDQARDRAATLRQIGRRGGRGRARRAASPSCGSRRRRLGRRALGVLGRARRRGTRARRRSRRRCRRARARPLCRPSNRPEIRSTRHRRRSGPTTPATRPRMPAARA